MPNTSKGLILLATATVSNSTTASVVLGSGGTIPQIYTHLVLRTSDATLRPAINDSFYINPNGSTSDFSQAFRYYAAGAGSSIVVGSNPGADRSILDPSDGGGAQGVFSSNEIWICNYSSTALTKTFMGFAATEAMNNSAYLSQNAARWSSTAAITSLTCTVDVGPYFTSGSTFYLYGVQIY